MKKNVLLVLLCSVLMLAGCSKNDNEGNTPGLFSAELYIHLSNFSDDVTVKANGGAIESVKYDKEKKFTIVRFSDPASTSQRNGTSAHEYILTLTSNTVLSQYPEGYQLKLVSNDTWTEVAKIYDKEGNEIPFTLYNNTSGQLKIELAN